MCLRIMAWLGCVTLVLIGLARPLWKSHIGLFLYPDHRWAFGMIADTHRATELLGPWMSPVCFGLASLLWLGTDRSEEHG
ncbi:hypothetical protein AA0535_0640 [Asaia krungthepensis NRIC 0535]|uniref:Uncharacterized protein n=2 Tax=Asaia krungthepensis TaxID=220990 RepID=A0ABQ0PYS8_9PROT|nr:hypothetical protein AA0535_0640 [Asaia krungthepensis NRIC 0535]